MGAHPKPLQRRLPSELRQEEIVKVALELAAKHGARGTTTHGIAAAMNLSQGAIFRHFPNKDAIWLAVIDWVRAQVGEMMAGIESAYPEPIERLRELFRAHARFVAGHASIPRLIFAELSQSDNADIRTAVQTMMKGYEGRLRAIFGAAKTRGLVAGELDEGAAATLFLSTLQGLALQNAVFGSERSIPQQAERLLPMLLRAIGAETSPFAPPEEGATP